MNTLVDAHIAAQAALRVRAAAAIAEQWNRLPSHDEATVPAFLSRAVPIAAATKRASVATTSSFLSRRLKTGPLGIDPADVVIRNGADPAEVYRRPFVTVWSALKNGAAYADAIAAGLARVESSIQTDAQLAMRQTLTVAGERETRIVGYQRVPDAGACDLCLMASTQRYRTDQLMPIHNHCGCGIDVIESAEEPGQVIDPELLRELKQSGRAGDLSYAQATSRARQRAAGNRAYARDVMRDLRTETDPRRRARLEERISRYDARAAAQENTALEYARQAAARKAQRDGTQLAVREHGELGPLLVNGADRFTDLAAIAA